MKLTTEMSQKVKATRKQLGLTQAVFARQLEISLPTLIDIERGQRGFIRPSTWSKIFDGVVLADAPVIQASGDKIGKPRKAPLEIVREISGKGKLSTDERKLLLAAVAKILELSI